MCKIYKRQSVEQPPCTPLFTTPPLLRKPYNAVDARHGDFPKLGEEDWCPRAYMVADFGGVRPSVSELLQAVCTKLLPP